MSDADINFFNFLYYLIFRFLKYSSILFLLLFNVFLNKFIYKIKNYLIFLLNS